MCCLNVFIIAYMLLFAFQSEFITVWFSCFGKAEFLLDPILIGAHSVRNIVGRGSFLVKSFLFFVLLIGEDDHLILHSLSDVWQPCMSCVAALYELRSICDKHLFSSVAISSSVSLAVPLC